MLKISACPSCGNKKVNRVQRDWLGLFHSHTYIVPQLEFYECSACGEKIYDREAMQKIEVHSPAFTKSAKNRKKRAA